MPAAIASLTVCRDAADPVTRQVEVLFTATPPLSEIVVVDVSASQAVSGLLAGAPEPVTVLRAPAEQGVAGGWAAGLEYAVTERRHEWVWTLDSASLPGASTLADLVAVSESLAGAVPLGILAPMPPGPGAVYPGLKWRKGMPPVDQDGGDLPVEFVDAVMLSGSLLSAAAIRAAGLPRRDFFIDFADLELCLRIRRAGFRVGIVPGTAMDEARPSPPAAGVGPPRLGPRAPAWREYYRARNLTFTLWREFPSARGRLRVVSQVLAEAGAVLLHDSEKWLRLALLTRGVADGLRGRLGRQVEPVASSES